MSIIEIITVLEKIHLGFKSLKKCNLLLQRTSISKIVEDYFGYGNSNSSKVKLEGVLSSYICNTLFPTYSTLAYTQTKEKAIDNKYHDQYGNPLTKIDLQSSVRALSVPSYKFNNVTLEDGTTAGIIWLYPESCNGLILNQLSGFRNDRIQPHEIFKIEEDIKPILCLVNPRMVMSKYYGSGVEITGSVVTAPSNMLANILKELDPFMINFLGNCYRPLSQNDGILAIDLREAGSKIRLKGKSVDFKFNYTVQGILDVGSVSEDLLKQINHIASTSIPDRQGMQRIKYFQFGDNPILNILTMGDIIWQYNKTNSGYSATIELNSRDPRIYQERFTSLSTHWNIWKKETISRVKDELGLLIDIKLLMCTNSNNAQVFNVNGFKLPLEIEEKILSTNPNIRRSIDWLMISTGK